MKSRLLVAAVGVPLLLVILLVCPKVVTAVALSLLAAIGARELLHTTGILKDEPMLILSMLMAFWMPIWSYLGCPIRQGAVTVVVYCILIFSLALRRYPEVKFEGVSGCFVAGMVIPMALASVLRILLPENGRYLVLLPILIPFIADAGAYFAGRALGKHKLAPVLSPNKTVEGAIGGFLTAILFTELYGLVLQLGFGLSFNYLYGAIYGLIGAPVAMVGDLSFSMVKRETGIKDYGTLFRAHGGVLDRFDSVIFAAPVVELLMLLLPVIA